MTTNPILKSLETAELHELRKEWERRYGVAPQLRSSDLLRRVLAWRIQAAAEGGLDRVTRRLLTGNSPPPEAMLTQGTVITRDWNGVRYEVEVEGTGYLYRGKRWKSLSEVARAITGTRWNGPRFFGLRDAA